MDDKILTGYRDQHILYLVFNLNVIYVSTLGMSTIRLPIMFLFFYFTFFFLYFIILFHLITCCRQPLKFLGADSSQNLSTENHFENDTYKSRYVNTFIHNLSVSNEWDFYRCMWKLQAKRPLLTFMVQCVVLFFDDIELFNFLKLKICIFLS